MAYQLLWEQHGAVARFEDVVTDSQINAISTTFYGHERFDSIHYFIVDFLGVTTFGVTAEMLERLGAMDRAAALSNPSVKVAIVTNDSNIVVRLAVYETATRGSSWSLCYFRNEDDARSWATN